jgi:hypothetical protein
MDVYRMESRDDTNWTLFDNKNGFLNSRGIRKAKTDTRNNFLRRIPRPAELSFLPLSPRTVTSVIGERVLAVRGNKKSSGW